VFSRDSQHLSDLAGSAAENGFTGIVVLGGDGTASHAARELIRSGQSIPIAVIPAGNGNDWSRTLCTRSAEAAIEAIVAGRTAILDAGRFSFLDEAEREMDGVAFINSAGIGLDAHVLQRSIRYRERFPLRKAAYVFALGSTLIRMPLWEGSLEMDGDEVYSGRYLSITVGVCPYVGGGMMLSPSSRPDDGRLDGAIVTPISRWKLIRNLPRIYNGTLLDDPSVKSWSGERFILRSAGRICVELDGERMITPESTAGLLIESLPEAVEAVVGANYRDSSRASLQKY